MTSAVPSSNKKIDVILIAPNVSEQMGGEAIKALQIYLELERQGVSVHQVTHIRARQELERSFPQMSVSYIADTAIEKALYRIKLFEQFLNMVFLRTAVQRVKEILKENPEAVIHFTSPISPILPYPPVPNAHVVIGPINGNIHYPPSFRHRETMTYKVRRWLHPATQLFFHRIAFSGKRRADALLIAGGQRTYNSMLMAGCRSHQFVDSIDSGVLDRFYDLPRITHSGTNLRFFYSGRLIEYKGADLIIRALSKTRNRIELDIIGRGPELEKWKALAASLSLQDRVTFVDWIPHHEMAAALRRYRAFVFPSLAEANGIVVQEAMVQGLPVIACNWGGPSLLVTKETGFLIDPLSEDHVINELAATMDRLSEDGELAEQMSINARQRAVTNGYLWSGVIRDWRGVYAKVLS